MCNNSRLGSIATLYFSYYSSRQLKTDSHRPASACLVCFELIWYILMCDLAFSVHLDLATLHALQEAKARFLVPDVVVFCSNLQNQQNDM